MTSQRCIAIGLACVGVTSALSAAPATTSEPAIARLIALHRVTGLTQVEYCMRNMPEIRLELSLAHATFTQALDRAADLLSQRFPSLMQVRLGSDGREVELALRSAQAEGPDRFCVPMLYRMHNATASSLTEELAPSLEILLEKVATQRSPN